MVLINGRLNKGKRTYRKFQLITRNSSFFKLFRHELNGGSLEVKDAGSNVQVESEPVTKNQIEADQLQGSGSIYQGLEEVKSQKDRLEDQQLMNLS